MSEKRHWLFKTEPGAYSIDDLKRDNKTTWDGVRNYQARNMLRDDISEGDRVLFYHSNTDPPAIVGTATVIRNGYPDHTQFEQGHPKFDPKASPDSPRWYMVDIQFEQAFTEPIPLDRLRDIPALKEMELLRKGSRLSVQPVSKKEWDAVMRIAR
ncbi:MAG: EVE domain-containing protein [Bacteroidetes bacterium]|nr:EVE domain-containing protein [Bacteroidota bacterium]